MNKSETNKTNKTYEDIRNIMKEYGGRREILIPRIINKFGYKTGIEIGVDKAEHATNILKKTSIFMYLVDNYADGKRKNIVISGKARYEKALNNLKPFNDSRYKLMVMNSIDAAKEIPDNSLDICYIDADHSYSGIKSDVGIWYPKVKDGCILSGHDYKSRANTGILQFINEFVKEKDLDLIVLSGKGKGWLIVK